MHARNPNELVSISICIIVPADGVQRQRIHLILLPAMDDRHEQVNAEKRQNRAPIDTHTHTRSTKSVAWQFGGVSYLSRN